MILVIKGYRLFLSPWMGKQCRFYPTCSYYAQYALESHGFLRGGLLAVCRILKCHPFHAGGYDPIVCKNINESIDKKVELIK